MRGLLLKTYIMRLRKKSGDAAQPRIGSSAWYAKASTANEPICKSNIASVVISPLWRKLPRLTDTREVELSGILAPGGSDEEVTVQ